MIRVIDGRKYLMRDTRPTEELRKLYVDFVVKYRSTITFHEWLNRGKIHLEIKEDRDAMDCRDTTGRAP